MSVSKNMQKIRNQKGFQPDHITSSVINYRRMKEIDEFYNLCQAHRDYYKDRTGKIRKNPFFEMPQRKYHALSNPTFDYIKELVKYYRQDQPIVYPQIMDRSAHIRSNTFLFNLDGKYDYRA